LKTLLQAGCLETHRIPELNFRITKDSEKRFQKWKALRQHEFERIEIVVKYARSKNCRNQQIAKYFGEVVSYKKCPNCDICTSFVIPQTQAEREEQQRLKKLQTYTAKKISRPTLYLREPVLQYLALCRPTSKEELLKIPGVGKGLVEEVGKYFEKARKV